MIAMMTTAIARNRASMRMVKVLSSLVEDVGDVVGMVVPLLLVRVAVLVEEEEDDDDDKPE